MALTCDSGSVIRAAVRFLVAMKIRDFYTKSEGSKLIQNVQLASTRLTGHHNPKEGKLKI
jgi:hypothetical protein